MAADSTDPPAAPGEPPPWSESDQHHEATPGIALTVVITFLFGLFGAIPAAIHAGRARSRGGSGSRYWKAFGLTLLASFALWVALVAGLLFWISQLDTDSVASPSVHPTVTPTADATTTTTAAAERPVVLQFRVVVAEQGEGEDPTVPTEPSTSGVAPTVPQESAEPDPDASELATPTTPAPTDIDDPIAWQGSDEWAALLAATECPTVADSATGASASTAAAPDQPAVLCGLDGVAYLLAPASFVGHVDTVEALVPSGSASWVVELHFDATGQTAWGDVTADLAGFGRQLAITDGVRVYTAPTIDQPMTGDTVQISGITIDEERAKELAAILSGE